MKKLIYLDNNATTAVDPLVFEVMKPYLTSLYGNASSMHSFGGFVGKAISNAREQVAQILNAEPFEIIFTGCGTESNNAALFSALQENPHKKHIVISAVEHPAVGAVCDFYERRGYEVTRVGVDDVGHLDIAQLKESLRDDTALVSIMYANNETGIVFPMEEITQIVKECGILLHCDAVQAAGKIQLDLKKMPIDMLSLSGHKLHAPKGVGVLYVRKGVAFDPFMKGGHQERERRAGTENVASIVAMGKACALAEAAMGDEHTRVVALRDDLESRLIELVPDAYVNGDTAQRLPNTTSIAFDYVEGESILLRLDEFGICASSGSACTSGSLEPSHVLRAMKIPCVRAHGSIRFSLSRFTTQDEINEVVGVMPDVIKQLREISPFTE